MRYDVCIIGAGADGLTAAAHLAARGLTVMLIERGAAPGGRCETAEFTPGFFASPFADELPAMPAEIFRNLDLARRGAILAPCERLASFVDPLRAAVIARVQADAAGGTPKAGLFKRAADEAPFPGEALSCRSRAELEAVSTSATLCDPALGGSALTLLQGTPGGLVVGGLGALGKALTRAATEAGAEISLGVEVTDIRQRRGRAVAVVLADGREFEARAILSTLDLKRTFLSLFAWNELPKALVERIGAFRPAPGIARLLVALSAFPAKLDPALLRHPIAVAADPEHAYHAWKSGVIPQRPPATVRLVSAVDPSLAPDGAAVATVTLGGIAHRLFDGPWTHEKRSKLQALALTFLEEALPGTAATVTASELLVPPDIENRLGLSDGDLLGGEMSAAQMLGFRPFAECRGTRTPVKGLYLAGPSSTLGPLATGAAGWAAATAILCDLKEEA
ncbi:MAG: FAD-dependent oxidoreductase [Rhizomicrobium sp.]|nr:FAD-dependent oxidoreductase [Rhizomicrobium sp.]